MKITPLIALAATFLATVSVKAGTKISVPVMAYEFNGYKNPPAHFKVNAYSSRELDKDTSSTLSWVWFGGKIANQTSSDARYELTVSFSMPKAKNSEEPPSRARSKAVIPPLYR